MQSTNFLKKAAVTAAAAALLLTAGCAAPQAISGDASTSSAAPSPSATAAAPNEGKYFDQDGKEIALQPDGSMVAMEGPYDSMLVTPSPGAVKAGDLVPITGGTLPPGTTVTVYGAQPMAMPSYDAANDMYHQVGEMVLVTEKITAVTDADGRYNLQLPLAADLGPQTINVIAETLVPDSSGATGALRMIYIE